MKRILVIILLISAYLYGNGDADVLLLSQQLCDASFSFDEFKGCDKQTVVNYICKSTTVAGTALYDALCKPEIFALLTDHHKKQLHQTMIFDEQLDIKTRIITLLKYVELLNFRTDRLRTHNLLDSPVKACATWLLSTKNEEQISSAVLVKLCRIGIDNDCAKEIDAFCYGRLEFIKNQNNLLDQYTS